MSVCCNMRKKKLSNIHAKLEWECYMSIYVLHLLLNFETIIYFMMIMTSKYKLMLAISYEARMELKSRCKAYKY